MAQKFYVVKNGRKTGIFDNWKDCEEQVKSFPNAQYKSFSNQEEAKQYLITQANIKTINKIDNNEINEMVNNDLENGFTVIFTDGSYDDKLKKYSYGLYIIANENNELKAHSFCDAYNNEKYLDSRNVAGEIFGVIKGIEWSISNNKNKIKFYYDYEGIEKWFNDQWQVNSEIAKLYKKIIDKNKEFFSEIQFQKVPAHSGIEYNEIADNLAKDAINDKNKKIKHGNSFCSISSFNTSDFKSLNNRLKKEIENLRFENRNENILELSLYEDKLTLTYYKNNKKLLIQGKISKLFIELITIISDFDNFNLNDFNEMLSDITKSNTNKKEINNFKNYPKQLIKKITTSIRLFSSNIEIVDWSTALIPIFIALEGYIKILLRDIGIILDEKINNFDCFKKNNDNKYELNDKKYEWINNIDRNKKNKIEICFNFFKKHRDGLCHFYVNENFSNAKIIESRKEAKELFDECIKLFEPLENEKI